MLDVDALYKLIDARVSALPPRRVPLAETLGLRLAEEVVAEEDEPAFDRSAMDGFAVPMGAGAGWFPVRGETQPGEPPVASLACGDALRVFTGSALPAGVRVIRQEDVTEREGEILVGSSSGEEYVRKRGSAVRKGEVLMPAKTLLAPAGLAVLAATGISTPRVIPRPRVAHLTTGSEIVEISQSPGPGRIRNANAPLIRALVEQADAAYGGHQHVNETLEAALRACERTEFADADLLLISGGSSGGKYDRTAGILEHLGFEILCRTVNCRPGKPFLFGVRGRQVAVGLPGNPVSHFVAFHLFVSRILRRLGDGELPPKRFARLCDGTEITPDARETFWPAFLADENVSARPWLDSGHLAALPGVNALIRVPARTVPPVGGLVEIVKTA